MPPQNNVPPVSSISDQTPPKFKISNPFPPKIFIVLILLAGILGSYQMFYGDRKEKVENLEVKQELTATDTSTWKTYRNKEYGFEFKYPDNLEDISKDKNLGDLDFYKKEFEEAFEVNLDLTARTFSESRKSGLNLDVINGKSLDEFLSFESREELWETYFYERSKPKTIQNFIIDNKKGIFREGPGELSKYEWYQILIENHGNQIIRIKFYTEQGWGYTMKLFDQILSTFKFLK